MTFRFVDAERANCPTAILCRVLGVSTSGFYEWRSRSRNPSEKRQADEKLTEQIKQILTTSRGTYGSSRIHAQLRLGEGKKVGRKRVARLMRLAGIEGLYRRNKGGCARRDLSAKPSEDLMKRNFKAQGRNELWTSEIDEQPALELPYRRKWSTRRDLASEIFDYPEAFYNPKECTLPLDV